MPKKPFTAYQIFMKANLPRIKEQVSDESESHLQIAQRSWKELDESSKQEYHDKSKKLKEKYQIELAKFYQKYPDKQLESDRVERLVKLDIKPKKMEKKTKEEEKGKKNKGGKKKTKGGKKNTKEEENKPNQEENIIEEKRNVKQEGDITRDHD